MINNKSLKKKKKKWKREKNRLNLMPQNSPLFISLKLGLKKNQEKCMVDHP